MTTEELPIFLAVMDAEDLTWHAVGYTVQHARRALARGWSARSEQVYAQRRDWEPMVAELAMAHYGVQIVELSAGACAVAGVVVSRET